MSNWEKIAKASSTHPDLGQKIVPVLRCNKYRVGLGWIETL